MRKLFIICILLMLVTISAVAQSGCEIDLEDSILSLVQAQRAADQGDTLTAVAILQGVQISIDGATSGCDRVRFNETFTAMDDQVSFSYPDGWQVQMMGSSLFVAASSSAVIDEIANDLPEDLAVGEGAIVLQVQPAGPGEFDEFVDDIMDDIRPDVTRMGPQEDIMIRGQRTISFEVEFNDIVSGYVSLVDYTSDEDPSAIMLILGVGNTQSLPIMKVYTETLRDSIQFPPGSSLREMGVSYEDISYASLTEFDDFIETGIRTSYLSNDGTKIAYIADGEDLCIYDFEESQETCATSELAFEQRPTGFFWSPDGRYIAFHADVLRFFEEGDIWIYDVENNGFTNLTDDGVDELGFGEAIEQETWLDFAITWGPDNMIYGVRQTALPNSDMRDGNHDIIRVDPDTGEMTTIVNLNGTIDFGYIYQFLPYSLDGALAVSPDASLMAVNVAGQRPDDAINGIWIVDLTTGDAVQVVEKVELTVGLPARRLADGVPITAISLAWDADGTGLFAMSFDGTRGGQGSMLHHIDLESGEIVPLSDLTDASGEDLALGSSEFIMPQSAVMTPDYRAVIVTHRIESTFIVSLVPFDNGFGEPQELFFTDELVFPEVVQMGLNGNLMITRVLLENEN